VAVSPGTGDRLGQALILGVEDGGIPGHGGRTRHRSSEGSPRRRYPRALGTDRIISCLLIYDLAVSPGVGDGPDAHPVSQAGSRRYLRALGTDGFATGVKGAGQAGSPGVGDGRFRHHVFQRGPGGIPGSWGRTLCPATRCRCPTRYPRALGRDRIVSCLPIYDLAVSPGVRDGYALGQPVEVSVGGIPGRWGRTLGWTTWTAWWRRYPRALGMDWQPHPRGDRALAVSPGAGDGRAPLLFAAFCTAVSPGAGDGLADAHPGDQRGGGIPGHRGMAPNQNPAPPGPCGIPGRWGRTRRSRARCDAPRRYPRAPGRTPTAARTAAPTWRYPRVLGIGWVRP